VTRAIARKGPIVTLAPASSLTFARVARMLRIEIGAELLKHLRLPIYAVSTIAFPVMFYLLFATMNAGDGPVHVPTYMLATYGAFGVIGASLFSFGVSVAVERAQGWMRLKRASPLPGAVTVVARLANALVFSAIIVAVLIAAGTLVAGVRLTPGEIAALLGVQMLAALPFCVIGQALGYALGPNSAPVVINLAYLPMAFASGLWMPIDILPPFVQAIAPWLPAYHHGQLALASLGFAPADAVPGHVAALLITTAIAGVAAVIAYRRASLATYG
jgi:ABC-2 type transport system permease protein